MEVVFPERIALAESYLFPLLLKCTLELQAELYLIGYTPFCGIQCGEQIKLSREFPL